MGDEHDPTEERPTRAAITSKFLHRQADQLVDKAEELEDRAEQLEDQASYLRDRAEHLHQQGDAIDQGVERS